MTVELVISFSLSLSLLVPTVSMVIGRGGFSYSWDEGCGLEEAPISTGKNQFSLTTNRDKEELKKKKELGRGERRNSIVVVCKSNPIL
jgi:hypothetical protein